MPKIKEAESIDQYRHIALENFKLKIISKVLEIYYFKFSLTSYPNSKRVLPMVEVSKILFA